MRDQGSLFTEVKGGHLLRRAEVAGLRRMLQQAEDEKRGIRSRLLEILTLTDDDELRAEIEDLIGRL